MLQAVLCLTDAAPIALLVLGLAVSAVVQAWVPRERIERALSGDGLAPLAKATGLGAASSSCSYAAIAIAKSLFLTDRAVEKHINSLFHKLDLTEEADVHRRVMAVLALLHEQV